MLQTADLTERSLLGEVSVDIRDATAWRMQNKDLIVAGKFFLKNEMFDRNEMANVTTKQLKPTSLNWV